MAPSKLRTHLPIYDSFRQEYLAYHRFLPIAIVDGRLKVAAEGVPDEEVLDDLREAFEADIDLLPTDADQLDEAIRASFASTDSVARTLEEADQSTALSAASSSVADARDQANQAPVIRWVNMTIRDAADAGASDVHLESTPEGLRVRFRIDGVLAETPAPPGTMQRPILSRIKLLADLDIAERRAPQDGRVRVRLEARDLDLRVAVVPTMHGESVVIRLLDHGNSRVRLPDLGMDAETFVSVVGLTKKANGVVIATGPTGSGKTTTLYAVLSERRPSEEKIITVEDPVEYYLSGVTQIPVGSGSVGFADILRSILRHDPDVIMVGEMRDGETAAVTTQAALTGHLVLSTLHTNDAVSAIARLVDLGIEPYIVAATLEGVVAQRLVRRTCSECRIRYLPDPSIVSLLSEGPVGNVTLERGAGCPSCRETGFRGRAGIFEVLVMGENIKRQLTKDPSPDALRRLALEGGMGTLRQDAWRKVQAGVTTVEEALRVLGT